jgi:hypothetical protein
VAVWAEQLEILQPVVEPVAVDVVEGQHNRSAPPVAESAVLALVLLEPLLEQADLQVVAPAMVLM